MGLRPLLASSAGRSVVALELAMARLSLAPSASAQDNALASDLRCVLGLEDIDLNTVCLTRKDVKRVVLDMGWSDSRVTWFVKAVSQRSPMQRMLPEDVQRELLWLLAYTHNDEALDWVLRASGAHPLAQAAQAAALGREMSPTPLCSGLPAEGPNALWMPHVLCCVHRPGAPALLFGELDMRAPAGHAGLPPMRFHYGPPGAMQRLVLVQPVEFFKPLHAASQSRDSASVPQSQPRKPRQLLYVDTHLGQMFVQSAVDPSDVSPPSLQLGSRGARRVSLTQMFAEFVPSTHSAGAPPQAFRFADGHVAPMSRMPCKRRYLSELEAWKRAPLST